MLLNSSLFDDASSGSIALGTLGCVGRAAKDFLFPHASLDFGACEFSIRFRSATIRARAEEPVLPGTKVPAVLPPELWSRCGDVRLGGGILNFSRAAQLIFPGLRLRYVDACAHDELLARELEYLRAEYEFLGLRALPCNAVFGAAGDKTILKSPARAAARLTQSQFKAIGGLDGCSAVVAQSIGDIPVMDAVLDVCKNGSIPLIAALTPSLPADYIRIRVLPVADVLFCSVDELSHICGFDVDTTPMGAVAGIRWVYERCPRAVVFLTLGKRGVLAAAGNEVVHVHMRQARLADVQSYIACDPVRVCGCGDAFSAGASMNMFFGRSLLSSDRAASLLEETAFAGCAAAVRWLGFMPPLQRGDFVVRALPLRHAGHHAIALARTSAVSGSGGADLL